MAINGLTYYVSVDSPNFKIKNSDGVATTSATTSASTIYKANQDTIYTNIVTISKSTYNGVDILFSYSSLPYVSYTETNDHYFQYQNDSATIGVSIPAEYTDTGTVNGNNGSYLTTSTVLTEVDPTVKMTWNSVLNAYIVESYSSVYNRNITTITGDNCFLTVANSTTAGSPVRFISASSESSSVYTTTLTESFTLYNDRNASTTVNTGWAISSTTGNSVTAYYSRFNNDSTMNITVFETYNADTNGIYTSTGSTRISWNNRVLVLDQKVTTSTSWINVPEVTQSSNTRSTYGVIADEEGNVFAGSMTGYGPSLDLGYPNFRNALRPAVITSFSKNVDVGTVDTSWYGTFSSATVTSNETRTYERYVEFNNHGIGGALSQGYYYWNTSSGTAFSESSRTSNAYMYYAGATAYVSITIPIANKLTVVISDNSFPHQSVTKSTVSRSSLYDYGSYISSGYSVTSEETLSEEVANTRTNFSTSFSVDFNVMAGNDALSVTSNYTTSATGMQTSYATTFLEVTVTSSCDVTSYSGRNGYAYYTTFYGELANETFYNTSWVNSAVVSSSTISRRDFFTMYTIVYTNKTFGDIVNNTTIHYESTISSKIFRTSSINNVVSELFVESSTSKSVDIPMEYFTTNYESWGYYTDYNTYMGPKIATYFSDRITRTSYNFNVTVTEVASYTYTGFIGVQESTSSTINTSAYGGTTYRLSDLISSSSWFNAGSVNGTVNYLYNYDVKSMFSLDDFITTLSNYTTALATSYSVGYDIQYDYDTYSVTKSSSLAARSTGERFIDRVEISRTSTIDYEVTNQIAIYKFSTMTTLSSNASSHNIQSEQDVSTVARTFISSTADLATTSEIASSTTATSTRGSFIYSSREFISSMTEQQNDTLIFASTFNTYSFYNSTYTTSTLNTVASTLSATTYEDWYNPASWTGTALSVATTTSAAETVNTTSGVVSVTQSVNYTPVYSTVDGVYVTA